MLRLVTLGLLIISAKVINTMAKIQCADQLMNKFDFEYSDKNRHICHSKYRTELVVLIVLQ